MEPKVNYTLIGLFVVLFTAALAVVVLWLGKGDYRKTYDRYYAYMTESVAGMSVNSPVKYRGVDVGRVKEIELNPDNPEQVRLTLDILRGTPVKEDTVAILDSHGLTGLAFVNLAGGSRDSPTLTAKGDQVYPVIKSGPSLLYRLDEALSKLLADQALSRLLNNSTGLVEEARLVLDEQNRASLKQALHDLATVTQTLAARNQRLEQGVDSAAQTFQNLAQVSKTLNEELPIILARVQRSVTALDSMSKELARTGTTVGAMVADTKPNLEQFTGQTLSEAGLLVTELRQLTATLQRVATQLEREPSSLVFGRAPQPRGPGE
jgi:phospholipid/cholesterol/gamma-HCH transport system substrate-binding protein